jgi:hypothetical protein
MKQMNSLFTCVVFITILSVIISCSKEGPAGPAGPAGSTGPQVGAGPKGDTGVANVIYSDWLDVTYKPDTVHNGTVIDTVGFYVDINAPKLSNAILTNGEIKVYLNLRTAAQPQIVPLPYFDPYGGLSINPLFFLQTIELYSNGNVSTFTSAGSKYQQCRYILIPGGVHGSIAPVDWNNYEAVKKYLGLSDSQ